MVGAHVERAPAWFGRKVARLPDRGTLIVATDLQGNFEDYAAIKAVYFEEKAAGNEPVLLLCGDTVHGPSERFASEDRWPDYLGTYYRDRSDELILDFMALCLEERAFSLLGNHEHAHVGGPIVSKFHGDEAAVLEGRLGDRTQEVREFMAQWPLVAVSACGAAFTHGAPRATERDVAAFERLAYHGYRHVSVQEMHEYDTLGALLWSRYASPEHAREFLSVVRHDHGGGGFVAFGHDVVRDGFEKIGEEQICLSTSFGLLDVHKYYLRLDLAGRYPGVAGLRIGHELRRLYPDR
jgi:hypothetical protein